MVAANKNMAAYMRQYRADNRDSSRYRQAKPTPNSAGRVAHHVPGHNAARTDGEPILRDEMIRRELRDGSGLMYPERVTGDHWRPDAISAELEAALLRRRG
jgi:hypothetical protein